MSFVSKNKGCEMLDRETASECIVLFIHNCCFKVINKDMSLYQVLRIRGN